MRGILEERKDGMRREEEESRGKEGKEIEEEEERRGREEGRYNNI